MALWHFATCRPTTFGPQRRSAHPLSQNICASTYHGRRDHMLTADQVSSVRVQLSYGRCGRVELLVTVVRIPSPPQSQSLRSRHSNLLSFDDTIILRRLCNRVKPSTPEELRHRNTVACWNSPGLGVVSNVSLGWNQRTGSIIPPPPLLGADVWCVDCRAQETTPMSRARVNRPERKRSQQ